MNFLAEKFRFHICPFFDPKAGLGLISSNTPDRCLLVIWLATNDFVVLFEKKEENSAALLCDYANSISTSSSLRWLKHSTLDRFTYCRKKSFGVVYFHIFDIVPLHCTYFTTELYLAVSAYLRSPNEHPSTIEEVQSWSQRFKHSSRSSTSFSEVWICLSLILRFHTAPSIHQALMFDYTRTHSAAWI